MKKINSSTSAEIQKKAEKRLKINEEMGRQLADKYERLRKSFGVTVNILVAALEMRDPYTAGHQQRSANVACAIAQEMGLPEDIIEGINIASTIHDIGNLSIPVEILTKPSKLTGKEYSRVKEHARAGFEMFKDVELPWPLAEIIYQHHERMDGSGYPRKLKGNKILLEARILAVADVVDAMCTQRPFRASLGLDAALEEIEKNRGTLYDKTVSDACLRLFRGNDYRIT
ncbi:MAG TPA: HD-GYP domain-containing protein [Smithella sp.]|nr:HD-GYP domain-containing protein [Smithella sp.]